MLFNIKKFYTFAFIFVHILYIVDIFPNTTNTDTIKEADQLDFRFSVLILKESLKKKIALF